jgi:hypothetical protein
MAGCVALVFNWWSLFVRFADPDHHREAITSRPLLLQAIGLQTRHAGRTTVTITSSHGEHNRARQSPRPHCRLLRRTTKNCGAVDHARTLGPHSQPKCCKSIFATNTRPAATAQTRRSCQLRLKTASSGSPHIRQPTDLGGILVGATCCSDWLEGPARFTLMSYQTA